MIRKTVRQFKRVANDWEKGNRAEQHIETIARETWWLFWCIPLYSRDTVGRSNM